MDGNSVACNSGLPFSCWYLFENDANRRNASFCVDEGPFINWAKMSNNIDQYAKVKLGGGNEFMAKGPLIFMSE